MYFDETELVQIGPFCDIMYKTVETGGGFFIVYARINATLRRLPEGRTAKCSQMAP